MVIGPFITGGILGAASKMLANKVTHNHWSYKPLGYITSFLFTGTFWSYIAWKKRLVMEQGQQEGQIGQRIGDISRLDELPDEQFDFAKDEMTRAIKKYSI